jgi:GNAT superfamily N-acetyltransferase
MATIQVEAATRHDVPLLLSLIRALAEYERMSADVVATEERLHHTLFGARPCAEAVVARVEGEAVGFALWFHNYSTFLAQPGLYLEDLFVLPAWRGRGVGAALLRHLARVAMERGCGRMEWSVLDWNAPAIGFYKKIGARPMDEWTVYRLTGDDLRRLANPEPEHDPRTRNPDHERRGSP